jgi:hypothetical protein
MRLLVVVLYIRNNAEQTFGFGEFQGWENAVSFTETAVFRTCRGSGIRTHDLADPNGAR